MLFRRISVFRSACSLAAVEAICEAEVDDLQSLLDKSLVKRLGDGAEPRFWMLETIREFAAEQLRESPAERRTTDRAAPRVVLRARTTAGRVPVDGDARARRRARKLDRRLQGVARAARRRGRRAQSVDDGGRPLPALGDAGPLRRGRPLARAGAGAAGMRAGGGTRGRTRRASGDGPPPAKTGGVRRVRAGGGRDPQACRSSGAAGDGVARPVHLRPGNGFLDGPGARNGRARSRARRKRHAHRPDDPAPSRRVRGRPRRSRPGGEAHGGGPRALALARRRVLRRGVHGRPRRREARPPSERGGVVALPRGRRTRQRPRRTADARRHDRRTRSRCGAARGSAPCHDGSGRRSSSGSRSEEPFSREPAERDSQRHSTTWPTRRRWRCRRSLSKRRSTRHESASPAPLEPATDAAGPRCNVVRHVA